MFVDLEIVYSVKKSLLLDVLVGIGEVKDSYQMYIT